MRRISRIELLGDLSTCLANALGRSIADRNLRRRSVEERSHQHPPDPTLYVNVSHARAHQAVHKPASLMLLKFTFPPTLELPLCELSKGPSMCQGINRRVLRAHNEIQRHRVTRGKVVRRVNWIPRHSEGTLLSPRRSCFLAHSPRRPLPRREKNNV